MIYPGRQKIKTQHCRVTFLSKSKDMLLLGFGLSLGSVLGLGFRVRVRDRYPKPYLIGGVAVGQYDICVVLPTDACKGTVLISDRQSERVSNENC